MGAFDDLIPRQSAGAFDDLIPKAPTASPRPEPRYIPPSDVPPVAGSGAPSPLAPILGVEGAPPVSPTAPQPVNPPLTVQAPMPARPDGLPVVGEAPSPFDGESLGALLQRRGQQFARGATEVIASQPEASAISAANLEGNVEQRLAENIVGLTERKAALEEVVAAFPEDTRQGQLARQYLADINTQLAAYGAQAQVFAENPTVPAQDRQSFALGDTIREASAETFGTPDPRDTTFWSKLAEGGGSFAGIIGTTMAGGAVAGPGGAFASGAATGAGINSSQLYREAISAGATEETAQDAAKWGAAIGASEVIPITRALKLLPPRLRGQATNRFLRKMGDIAQASGEEAAQEFAAQVANNLVAQGYYDPERGWNEGAGEAALIGAILGGGVGAVIPSSEAASRPPETPEEPLQGPETPEAPEAPQGPSVSLPATDTRNAVPIQQEAPVAPTQEAAPTPDTAAPVMAPEPVVEGPRVADVVPEPPRPQARPLTAEVRRGGIKIDPQSRAGQELAAGGVTPRTAPGLFARGGQTDLDNLVAEEYPGLRDLIGTDDTGTYLNPNALIDAIISESNGRPVQNADQAAAQAAFDEYQRTRDEIYQEYQDDGVIAGVEVPAQSDDFLTGVDRMNNIVDTYEQVTALMNVEVPAEMRQVILDDLDANGGNIEVAIENALTREILNVETQEAQSRAAGESIPGFDEPVSQPREQGQGAEGAGNTGRFGADAGFAVEDTPEGQQYVVPGSREDGPTEAQVMAGREAAVQQQQSKMRRSGQDRVEDDPNSMFGPQQGDIFDQPAEPAEAPTEPKSKLSPESKAAAQKTIDDTAKQYGFELEPAVAPDDPDPVNTGRTQPKGTLGPSYLSMSFTDRQSMMEDAFVMAGVDPAEARNWHTRKQIDTLKGLIEGRFGIKIVLPQKIVQKKNIAGRKVDVPVNAIMDIDAINQLLDAWRGLQMMTHVTGLPPEAVALKVDGKPLELSLTAKLPGALGMYEHDGGAFRRIHLPGRSNSFAHEWGHALDHFLGIQLTEQKPDEIQDLFSRNILEDGIDPTQTPNERLSAAFVSVIRTLYTDKAELAAMQIELETRAAKDTPDAKEAQKILDDLKAGKAPPQRVWSRYFKDSKEFDRQFAGGRGYFPSAVEMFARAYESFISSSVRAVSDLPAGFLTKPNWAYKGSDDTRAKMTFPKDADADHIYLAFSDLMKEIGKAELFPGKAAEKPSDANVFDMTKYNMPPKMGIVEMERDAWAVAMQQARGLRNKKKDKAPSLASAFKDTGEAFGSSTAGYMRAVVARQPKEARAPLTKLLDMFMDDLGSGRLIKRPWEVAVEQISKSDINRFTNIVSNHKLNRLDDAGKSELRRMLVDPDFTSADKNIAEAAKGIRVILNQKWSYMRSAGIKGLGYAKNGYLPRILDRVAVTDKADGFRTQAAKVYRLMFKRDIREEGDLDTQIEDARRVHARLRRATREDNDGGAFRVDLFDEEQNATLKDWQSAVRRKKALERKEKNAKDEDVRQAIEAEYAQFMEEEFAELHEEALNVLEDVYAEESALNWHTRIISGSSMDFDTLGPANQFLNSRTMPEETDMIMEEYFDNDPLTLIPDYFQMATRRAEYVRRVGFDGRIKENLIRKASRVPGVSASDIKLIRATIEELTGRSTKGHMTPAVERVHGWAYVTATLSLLDRATFSSLVEYMATGIRTGNVFDSYAAFFAFVGQMASRLTGSNKAAARAEVARAIGLVTSAQYETIMLNRFGGDIDPNRLQGRMLAGFFQKTMLTQLTNVQRTAMLSTADRFVTRQLRKALKDNRRSVGELADLGIGMKDAEALLAWRDNIEGFPTAADLKDTEGEFSNDAAELWAQAVARMTEQVIQNPRRYTRPKAALDPRWRMIYGIMGFQYAFHTNLLVPLFKRGIDADAKLPAKALGVGRNLAQVALPVASLYMAAAANSILREMLFNEEWDGIDWEDEEEVRDFALKSLSRSGLLGAWDRPYNMLTGLKYRSDPASTMAGPHLGWWFGNFEDFARLGTEANTGSNWAEHKATETAANLLLDTGTTMILSAAPGSPIMNGIGAAAIWGMSRYSPGEMIAQELFPRD